MFNIKFNVITGNVVDVVDKGLEQLANHIDENIPKTISFIEDTEKTLVKAKHTLSRLLKYSQVLRDLLKTEQA